MNVREMIDQLKRFPADAEVRVAVTWPDRVTETHERVLVGDYGGGPMINAAMDLRGVQVFVGCSLQRPVGDRPQETIALGHYERAEVAARVRDFYIIHEALDEPLNFPTFDYEKWIPPKTTSGEYNEHIAAILREKLMEE